LKRKILLTLGFLVVLLVSACTLGAPAPASAPVSPPAEPDPVANEDAPTDAPTATPEAALAVVEQPTEKPPVVDVMPTSRGNELHATDPETVNVASGRPQLIEFFAFW